MGIDETTTENYSKKSFTEDLIMFANEWIADIAVPIMRRTDEFYEDAAIRFMVREYANAKREHISNQTHTLRMVARGYTNYDEDSYVHDLMGERANEYREILYRLLA